MLKVFVFIRRSPIRWSPGVSTSLPRAPPLAGQALGLPGGQARGGSGPPSAVLVPAYAAQGRHSGQRALRHGLPGGRGARGSYVRGLHAATTATAAAGRARPGPRRREAHAGLRGAGGQAAGRCARRRVRLRGLRVRLPALSRPAAVRAARRLAPQAARQVAHQRR